MITLYHNNRCSKSRAAASLLDESKQSYETHYYLDQPLVAKKLQQLLDKGDFSATDLVRFGDAAAKELGISKKDERTDLQWCELLEQHPKLLQRPIVETDTKAVIGRPTENIQALLD